MHYEMYVGQDGYWRWRFVAANNRIIAMSSESYHNQNDCLWSVNLVKGSSAAPVRIV